MATSLVEHASSRMLSATIVEKISTTVAGKLASTRRFFFAKILYRLISDKCEKNIAAHLRSHLPKIELSHVDIIVLKEKEQEAVTAIVGEIVINAPHTHVATTADPNDDESASDDEGPSAASVVTGSAVEASGLCQLYFSALSARVAQFGWDAIGQVVSLPNFSQWPTVFTRSRQDSMAVDLSASMIGSPRSNKTIAQRAQLKYECPESMLDGIPACMNDELVEKRLPLKLIALTLRCALLPLYSDQQLFEAMIDLHNSKDPFTASLRKNSNFFSAIIGKDTHSWKEAVGQIKAEAQRRIDSVAQSSNLAPEITPPIPTYNLEILQAITNYQSSIFSASDDAATNGPM